VGDYGGAGYGTPRPLADAEPLSKLAAGQRRRREKTDLAISDIAFSDGRSLSLIG